MTTRKNWPTPIQFVDSHACEGVSVTRLSDLKKGTKYTLLTLDSQHNSDGFKKSTWDVRSCRGFLTFVGIRRPRQQPPKYVFEYLTRSGNKGILELGHDESFTRMVHADYDIGWLYEPRQAKIFYRYGDHVNIDDPRGVFVLLASNLLNKATLASIRRNLAAQKIGKAMYTAWLNPYTAYGRRRLLREFNELRLGRA